MKLLPSLDCRLQTERTAGEIGVILKSVTISVLSLPHARENLPET